MYVEVPNHILIRGGLIFNGGAMALKSMDNQPLSEPNHDRIAQLVIALGKYLDQTRAVIGGQRIVDSRATQALGQYLYDALASPNLAEHATTLRRLITELELPSLLSPKRRHEIAKVLDGATDAITTRIGELNMANMCANS